MPELKVSLEPSQGVRHLQRLMALPQMRQALQVLQMPILELRQFIETSLAENPLVQELASTEPEEPGFPESIEEEITIGKDFSILDHLDENFSSLFEESEPHRIKDTKKLSYRQELISASFSISEHLMKQAREVLTDPTQLTIAKILIGNLDERGFLHASWNELQFLYGYSREELQLVLQVIQNFEPWGVGATSLQESLLIQLHHCGDQETLAYGLIEQYYPLLLKNQLPLIQKKLKCTREELHLALQKIAKLNLSPCAFYQSLIVQAITPDVNFLVEGEEYRVIVNNDYLPEFHLNRRYMRMLENPTVSQETKHFIREKFNALKWLMKNVQKRESTLLRVSNYLLHYQKEFFERGDVVPLTLKQVADQLGLNESTIARALMDKYFASPRGIFSFKVLFSVISSKNERGEVVSQQNVQERISTLIEEENKKNPLSDAVIAAKLLLEGISCARRTVAKYRNLLKLTNARSRKKY